jgi:hypothetical protein
MSFSFLIAPYAVVAISMVETAAGPELPMGEWDLAELPCVPCGHTVTRNIDGARWVPLDVGGRVLAWRSRADVLTAIGCDEVDTAADANHLDWPHWGHWSTITWK